MCQLLEYMAVISAAVIAIIATSWWLAEILGSSK